MEPQNEFDMYQKDFAATESPSMDALALLHRCRNAWVATCTAWIFASLMASSAFLLWVDGTMSAGPTVAGFIAMLASLGLVGGFSCVGNARLTDIEQARLAVSDLSSVAKALLAMSLEQGFWAFQRTLPVVLHHLAIRQPGSQALARFKQASP